MLLRCLPAVLALAACNGPSPYFRDVPVTRIDVDGSVFDIRVRGELAEAVRVNPQYAPRFGPIRARAGFAMAVVSGCDIRRVQGDQAVAVGVLDCNGDPRPVLVQIAPSYSCLEVSQWLNEGPGPNYSEFECDPF